MKFICLLIFYFMFQASNHTQSELVEIRNKYYAAIEKEKDAKDFLDFMNSKNTSNDPLMLCYKGVATVLQANYYFNPYSKYKFFVDGKELIEKSVKQNSSNIEIRFMRFCIQYNTPKFLGYSNSLEVDKKFIFNSYNGIVDIDLKERIKNYLLKIDICTKAEKEKLR